MTKHPVFIDEPGSFLHAAALPWIPAVGDLVTYQNSLDGPTTRMVAWRRIESERVVLGVEYLDAQRKRARASHLWEAIEQAIAASDNGGGSASDAIQDMLEILRDALGEP